MKRLSRLVNLSIVIFTVLLCTATVVFAAGGIDWEKSMITATGTGLPPQNAVNPAQARMLARRAAMVDAYRMLAESIKGVNVDAETTVENLVVSSDIVKTKVSACIKGAQIIGEREIPGGYEVTMQLPMFGDNNPLAAAVLQRAPYQEPFPEPDESVDVPAADSTVEVDVNVKAQNFGNQQFAGLALQASYGRMNSYMLPLSAEASNAVSESISNTTPARVGSVSTLSEAENAYSNLYTGLIVDCRGLGLNAAMSPVIKNKKGEPIYGHKNLDYDLVISKGMVSYVNDIDNYDRAGSRPLIVKAIELQNFNGNPVISVKDANKVLIENKKSAFLDRMNVVFVR